MMRLIEIYERQNFKLLSQFLKKKQIFFSPEKDF